MGLYRIQSTAAAATAPAERLPANLTLLSLSWIQGHVEAVAIHRGEIVGSWTFPDPVDDLARFGDVVREAAARTHFQGNAVSLVLSHPRMAHQLLETPPAKGTALNSLIESQINRLMVFDGGAAWSYEPIASERNQQLSLVHLFPRPLLDGLIRATERVGMHLISLIPITAVLRNQLARLPGADKDAELLIAESGEMRTLMVGRRNCEILLVRSLDSGSDPGGARLGVDLNRTLLFVNQQFGTNVAGIWLFGNDRPERVAELQGKVPVPVRPCPDSPRPLYWAEEAARLPAERNLNLVGREQRKAPQRKAILRATTVVAVLLVLAAGTTVAIAQFLARREAATIRSLETQIAALQVRHLEAQRIHAELALRENAVVRVVDGRLQPVPAWFLAYLGDVTPRELRLTDVKVRRDGDLWHFRMEGLPQPTLTNANRPILFSNAVVNLSRSLQSGPFHAALAGGTNGPIATALRSGPAAASTSSWVARRTAAQAGPADRFLLEGWMK